MKNKTTSLASHSSQVVLHFHPDKTKILKINTFSTEAVKLGDNNLEEVKSFMYFGSVINQQERIDADMKTRIRKARASGDCISSYFAPKSACSTPTSNWYCCMEERRGEQQRPSSRKCKRS
jgi:hypothetical protein